MEQRVENIVGLGGATVTLSFYAKGTNPGGGSLDVEFENYYGSGGSVNVAETTDSFTLTSSWQQFTVTKTLTSLSGKTVGTGSFLQVKFKQPDGDTSTDAWTLDITGMQLEYGNVATPFEHRSFGEELALCQRYFVRRTYPSNQRVDYGYADTTTRVRTLVPFYQEMRASPSSPEGTDSATFVMNGSSCSINTQNITLQQAEVVWERASGSHSVGAILQVYPTGGEGSFDFDSEL
jgi:hypothetical protein